MTDRTITKTRTEINYEEVEETLYVCRNCDQAFQDENIVPVPLGDAESEEDREYRQLCNSCSESVLDYAPDSTKSVRDVISENTEDSDATEIIRGLASHRTETLDSTEIMNAGLGISIIIGMGMVIVFAVDIISDLLFGTPPLFLITAIAVAITVITEAYGQ